MKTPKPRIMIVVEGGVIQNIVSTIDIGICLVDHDNDDPISHLENPYEVVSDATFNTYLQEAIK